MDQNSDAPPAPPANAVFSAPSFSFGAPFSAETLAASPVKPSPMAAAATSSSSSPAVSRKRGMDDDMDDAPDGTPDFLAQLCGRLQVRVCVVCARRCAAATLTPSRLPCLPHAPPAAQSLDTSSDDYHPKLVGIFCEVLGVETTEASFYLESSNWEIEPAFNIYLSMRDSTSKRQVRVLRVRARAPPALTPLPLISDTTPSPSPSRGRTSTPAEPSRWPGSRKGGRPA
jgi:hypothetical protein